MVGISPDRDGNGFRAFLLPAHPVKAFHPRVEFSISIH
ncbi:unnamed protein product [Linum tenue]|uniref:Uncharacterized protein n=1 Tax=Linum tenue TaxID=586396 RepID=A0AAV0J4V5_9ROSI|nr:unnamed protein product [Linum tenue]